MKRCLIVVDFQNDFISGVLGFEKAEKLIPLIAEKIKEYRKSGDDIIFTLDTHGEDYMSTHEGRHLPLPHCIKGTEGHTIHSEIEKLRMPSDAVFEKCTFGSDRLFDYMRENPYECIELCGLVSNICVLSNAVLCRTAQPRTLVTIDACCTASADAELHKAALKVLKGIHVNITNEQEIDA